MHTAGAWPVSHPSAPQVLVLRTSLDPFSAQPVLVLGIAPTLATGTGCVQCQGFRLQGSAHFTSWSSGTVICVFAGLKLAQRDAT